MRASSNKPLDEVLAGVPMFRHLAAARLRELARQARLHRIAKGTVLYNRGDAAEGCHALLRGLVKLSLRAPGGAEKVLRLVAPGETFGEAAVFGTQPHAVAAVALAASEVVFLPAAALIGVVNRDRAFARALLAELSRGIQTLTADIESYSFATGTQRIAAYLCALAGPSARAPAQVRLPASKTVIASRLGITKETFSRLLHELMALGLVEVSRHDIMLHDPRHLAELARG